MSQENIEISRPSLGIILLAALTLASMPAAVVASTPGVGKSRTCFGKQPTILGTPQRDSIPGTNGSDVIIALDGNDGIRSREGDDYVCAGSGDDVIHGAEGVNHMNGGSGDDWLDGRRGPGNESIGSRGNDVIQAEGKIDGGPGNDTIESYGYCDRLSGPVCSGVPNVSPFPDVTDGGTGRDKIYGCGGQRTPQLGPRPSPNFWAWPHCYTGGVGTAELLKGGSDSDKVFGAGGDDRLRGNGGADRLYGENGDDNLDGGSGRDVCLQGPGTGPLTRCP